MMKQKRTKRLCGFLMILLTLIATAGISIKFVMAAPPDLVTATIVSGDIFTAKLDAAAGGNRNNIVSLKIITSGYSLSNADFRSLKDMVTSGKGLLTYLDLVAAVCEESRIPDWAFDNTENNIILKQIILPNSITQIGIGAFYNCSGLMGNLTIPNTVTSIGNAAFCFCSGFTGKLTIPNSVTSIGNFTFRSCSGFSGSLTIPNSVTSIDYGAFYQCTGFTGNLTISSSLTSIGSQTFYNCSGLTGSLTIPNSVTSIGGAAFRGCDGLSGNLVISNNVTSIGNGAFENCSGLTGSLTIPNSVTSIGSGAFYGCSGLSGDLTIPNSVTSIGHRAFYNCSGFNGYLSISNSVTNIDESAFDNCSGLRGSLLIPNSVTSIGNYAFRNCSGLSGSLIIPNKVTSIGDAAFYDCSGFTGGLTIPNGVTSIGNSAFFGCSGFTGGLTIPNGVTSISNGAFWGCSGFKGKLFISESITKIDNYAFCDCSGLTGSLMLPDGMTYIGASAFENCRGLTGSLHIPDNVITIDGKAFKNCSELTGNLHIADSVITIGSEAFANCRGLSSSLYISKNITSIGAFAFSGPQVTSITYNGLGLTDLNLSLWFGTSCSPNTSLTVVDIENSAAISISATDFTNLTTFNFSGMTNLARVTINAGKIDFSGGAAGAWYNSFSGTKNICCQRPAVFTKKAYPVDTLGLNSVFSPPAPSWVTASNIDVAALTSADWFESAYAGEVFSRSYTLAYTGPDGNSEPILDTTKPGNHTVSYSFSGYAAQNYSRQYTVSTEILYTVSFNSNGGSAVNSQSVKYNAAATEPAAPSRSGYTFAGWYTDSGLTAGFSFTTPITANITLYAKWIQIKVVIASEQVLSESTLDGGSLQVTLYDTAFNTTLLSGFTITSTISNLSIEKITYVDSNHCIIDLAYTSTTGMGSNTGLKITIPGGQLTVGRDLTSNSLTVSADLVSGKTIGTYIPASNSDILTAYNSRNEYSTYWNGTTLDLGKRTNGWNNDGWLYFPNVISATPSGYNVDRAELVLSLSGVSGESYLPRWIKIYMITDPNNYGIPYFGSSNGYRTGLNFNYRDNRMNNSLLWKTGAADILKMFDAGEPLDVYEFIPQEYGSGLIRLDVTDAFREWRNGSPNQGFYIVGESHLLADDQLHLNWKDFTEGKPYLQLVYAPTTMSLDRPAKVKNFTAQSFANSVTLQWDAAGHVRVLRKTGATSFDPEDGTLVYEGAASSFTDNGLEKDQSYYYAIFAYDSNRTYSARTGLKARTGDWSAALEAPTFLSSPNQSATTITLTWTDNSTNETGFVVERWIVGAGWTQIASLPADQTSFRDYGLQPNTSYQYQVKAINPIGPSAYASGSAMTGNGLVAPTKLSCKVMSYSQVRLEWTDSSNETGYRIQVLNSSGTVIRTINNIAKNTAAYQVGSLAATTSYSFKVIAIRGTETAVSETTETVTTLPKVTSVTL